MTTTTNSSLLALCLVAAAAACGSDTAPAADDPSTTETTLDTAPPTTLVSPADTLPPVEPPEPIETDPPATTSTTTPSTDLMVPFSIIDATFPEGWTCDDAIAGFDVAFADDNGDRNLVSALFANASAPVSDATNAACSIETFEGSPALFIAAQLEVPAADGFSSIEVRYPYLNGDGNDRYASVFETITTQNAESGLFMKVVSDPSTALGLDYVVIDPSTARDLAFPPVG